MDVEVLGGSVVEVSGRGIWTVVEVEDVFVRAVVIVREVVVLIFVLVLYQVVIRRLDSSYPLSSKIFSIV